MSTGAVAVLPEQLLDEVWMIMNKLVQDGAHFGAGHGPQESEITGPPSDVADDLTPSVEPQYYKKKKYFDVAEKLGQMGDDYSDKNSLQAQKELEEEIANYINSKAREIEEKFGNLLPKLRPQDVIFQSGIFNTVYGYFRSKLETFVKGDESLTEIAFVSHVVEGVAISLKEATPMSVYVVTCLATRFINDRYGDFLKKKGGLVHLVESAVD